MVKRWTIDVGFENDPYMDEWDKGEYVLYSDYQALQKALEEALDGYYAWIDPDWPGWREAQDKVSQLRSLYLRGEREEEFSKQVQYVDGVAVGIQYGPKNK